MLTTIEAPDAPYHPGRERHDQGRKDRPRSAAEPLREINARYLPAAHIGRMDFPDGPKLPVPQIDLIHAVTKSSAKRRLQMSAFRKLALPDTDESPFDERLKQLANARRLKAQTRER